MLGVEGEEAFPVLCLNFISTFIRIIRLKC